MRCRCVVLQLPVRGGTAGKTTPGPASGQGDSTAEVTQFASRLAGAALQGIEVGRHDRRQVPADLLHRPVPPGDGQQALHHRVGEALLQRLGRVATDHGVGRHVAGHHRARGDDGTVADLHPRHDQRLVADPHVVADQGVALVGELRQVGHVVFPATAEDLEGVGGEAGELVVGAVHDELHPARDGAEAPDHQAVTDEGEEVEHVALEVLRILRVVVVGVFADLDLRVAHRVADEADLGEARHGVRVARVGAVHGTSCALRRGKERRWDQPGRRRTRRLP